MMDAVRINFPPDPNPKKPRLKIPQGAWDTHFHVWGPPAVYPYASDHHYYPMPSPIEHYFAVAEILGFERGVIVQPRAHHQDIAIVLDAIRKSEGRLRGVVCSDSNFDDGDLRKLHDAGIRGMRIELGSERRGGYDEKGFNLAISRAAKFGWSVALHLDPEIVVRLADVIGRIPIRTIIENYASMDARLGIDQPAMRTIRDLSAEPHVWIKAASAYRMLRKDATYDQVLAIARAMHSLSPDRTIWGTDWPHGSVFVPGKMPNDGDLVDMLSDFVPDEKIRHKLLVTNPQRLFDFD